MSQLRSDATQAIAQALWSKVQDEYDDEWADIALDALLDFLEAHAEEWEAAALGAAKSPVAPDGFYDFQQRVLIAALRASEAR